ncbi:hypothetical protein Pmgp_03233 [Pelotomaculum propionicicum]|uniref:Uncharacterized protein n=1 Tax=Pelotomaculum propionicicum TaxID=258475 RepID=A0A4Y7RKH7_9FIRM|nr:hypothetical protein Pmgp_03233 [Pelotomaculum propionicicum]
MILTFLNLGLYIFLGLPIALFLLWFFAIVSNSFFGGPVWLWFTIFLIIGICSCIGKFSEELRKIKKQNEANQS